MKDIGVYTTPEVLKHKQKDGFVYWDLPFSGIMSLEEMTGPGCEMPERIWFASNGCWQGYFVIETFHGNEIHFHSSTWTALDNPSKYSRKPFRGFTYKVPE